MSTNKEGDGDHHLVCTVVRKPTTWIHHPPRAINKLLSAARVEVAESNRHADANLTLKQSMQHLLVGPKRPSLCTSEDLIAQIAQFCRGCNISSEYVQHET